MANKKIPISRLNKFYDKTDFDLENDMAREYVEGDLNFTVVLFEVDRTTSVTDDIYAEASSNELKFKPPKELKVRLLLEDSTKESYAEGHIRYEDYGDLIFTIFVEQLEELGSDIIYGDYIGYPDKENNIKYFTVYDDGKIFSDNSHTRLGYLGYYRTIKCKTADFDEINPDIMPL